MENYIFILNVILSIIFWAICIPLILYIIFKRDKFPFTNIICMWIIVLLICNLISQFFYFFILIFKDDHSYDGQVSYIILINGLFIHYIMIWPIIGRVYHLSKSIEFNYSFLLNRILSNLQYYENQLYIQNKKFTELRNIYVSKLIFIPLLLSLIIILICSQYPYVRCVVYGLSSLAYFDDQDIPQECPDFIKNTSSFYFALRLMKVIFDHLVIFIYIYFLFAVFKFPIKNDKFYTKLELFSIFVIWIIVHNLYHGYSLYTKFNKDTYYYMGTFENYSIAIVYFYITWKRSKININEFYEILYNFDKFMMNPICFSYFKDYLKKSSDDEYILLYFWIDYFLYKNKFDSNLRNDNIERANSIFINYFSNIKITNDSRRNINNTSNYIDFPIEITDNVDESANIGFDIEDYDLKIIFDEAFEFINNKLYNRYLAMFRNEKDITEIEKLICYIEFKID